MRKVILLFILFSAVTLCIQGQSIDWDPNVPASWLKGATVAPEQPGIQGSIYVFDDWLEGTLLMKNGRFVDDIKINFAGQNGDLVISRPYHGIPTEYNVIESDVVSVTILPLDDTPGRHYMYLPIDSVESTGTGGFFYEVLLDDQVTLLKKSYKQFVRARQREAYSNGANEAKYVLMSEYFVKIPGKDNYEPIRLNRKIISDALGKNLATKAKGLAKKNKWKWTRDEDVSRLLEALFE
jgi:hypothetical protein